VIGSSRPSRGRTTRPANSTGRSTSWTGRCSIVGLCGAIPQVLVTRVAAQLLGPPGRRADIGPRFAEPVAKDLGHALAPPFRWALEAAFHFGYADRWRLLYGLAQQWRPVRPLGGGPLRAAVLQVVAFSPWGAATQAGAERAPEHRPECESLLHWTAALTSSLVSAYTYPSLHECRTATPHPLGGTRT
jgi:hypothetical protein